MKNVTKTLFLAVLLLASIFSFAQTPIYNSYPSASAAIFLDFDGHSLSGSSWNTSINALNLGPSNLNASQITEVFNRVAEDYRPFNVNITTDSAKYWAAPVNKRMRIILTITSDWYGAAGGVSYTNSFSWGDNTPCFVFTALLNYNIKYISEATAHEAGHTLGLRHQSSYDANCSRVSDYNSGVGDGEIGWAPIMGVGYYKNFTLWHNGSSSAGCTAAQSDLSIITNATNGIGYRVDDHSSKFTDATTAN
ncbi:MAG TPA: M57 family metalloprotease, partial [Chitinophagaceae bacterium]|nr:M57 family metalloprotease [Chitinophagaceae bacterium]